MEMVVTTPGRGRRRRPREGPRQIWEPVRVDTPVDRLDAAFLSAASTSLHLIRSREVSDRWTEPSALPKMSVGALACHLGRQAVRAAEVLPVATDVAPLDSAAEHYRSAPWVRTTSPDEPPNDRTVDDAEAALGPAALERRATDALESVRDLLAAGGAREVVLVPWQGWSLRRHDFLLTRLVEIVVHTDDLAASVEVPPPTFAHDAFTPVLDLLTRLAVARHGQSAVISTLARTERTRTISAF
jgi:hypothetical protein